ncbi:MAG: flippase-like domain-containing protein [Bacteroidales bacterium]|nr:flippase-like domain-containing protein [Bacteroidales bacterium]
MKGIVISVLKYLFFIALGVALLFLAFRGLAFNELWEELKTANYWWFLVAIILAILSHIFRALRWNLLIEQMGYKTRTSTTFYSVMMGYLANLALPRLGEVTRCGFLSKKENIPFNALFGTVIAERVFDLVVLLFIIVMVVVTQIQIIGGFLNEILVKPFLGAYYGNFMVIIVVVLGLVLLILLSLFIFRKLKPWLKTTTVYGKIESFIDGFMDGLKSIAKLKQKILFFLYTFAIWLLYLLMIVLPFYAFAETSFLTFTDGITVLGIGSLGVVAPVPGGIGSYHFIITELLSQLYEVPVKAAAAYATANHAAQTIMIIVVGLISYILLILVKTKPRNE